MPSDKGTAMRMRDRFMPAFCNVFGTVLILAVFALTLPLSLPRMMGYQIFEVVSGSMEPAIPAGSVIYVRQVDPADVQVDEVIAFRDGNSVVAHRVVLNRGSLGEFVTKGDANNVEDLAPIPYENLIGLVVLHLPLAGEVMALYASTVGKVYLVLTLACGVMLNILADRLRRQHSLEVRRRLEKEMGMSGQALTGALPSGAAGGRRGRRQLNGWMLYTAMGIAGLVFVGSTGVVLYVRHQYAASSQQYAAASANFTTKIEKPVLAPIRVDFDSLCAVNDEVVGWLYCEGTAIDYPVLHGQTNDDYLRHDYNGDYNINGSIFVDAQNARGFADANTIIYGHHMSTGTMFATLEDWGNQAYYEAHPVMWLLTPQGDYRVELFSGRHVSAYGEMYQILHQHDAAFDAFLAEAVAESDFTPVEGVFVDPDSRYIMLTTCAYVFDSARYVLHGKLVPVNSVGGQLP